MRYFVLFQFAVLATFPITASEISIGENVVLHSGVTGEGRPIWIYTPVHESDERLYVIYLLVSAEHFYAVTGVVKSLTDYGFVTSS